MAAGTDLNLVDMPASLIERVKVWVRVVQMSPAGLHELDPAIHVVGKQADKQAAFQWQI